MRSDVCKESAYLWGFRRDTRGTTASMATTTATTTETRKTRDDEARPMRIEQEYPTNSDAETLGTDSRCSLRREEEGGKVHRRQIRRSSPLTRIRVKSTYKVRKWSRRYSFRCTSRRNPHFCRRPRGGLRQERQTCRARRFPATRRLRQQLPAVV